MFNSYEFIIEADEAMREMLVAELSEIGFDAFEEIENALKAYVPHADFREIDFQKIINKYSLKYCSSTIKKQNWNKIWESNFEPIQIDDFVRIRASFHPESFGVEHEMVITPKMSFGTGTTPLLSR